jgi:hypothetical protein
LTDELFNGLSFAAELADGGELSLREAIRLANSARYDSAAISIGAGGGGRDGAGDRRAAGAVREHHDHRRSDA